MSYLFQLVFGNGKMLLSIKGKTIVKPKVMFGLMEFADLKRICLDLPYKGGWIPYIEISNIFSKGTKSIGVSQAMADSYEIVDTVPKFHETEEVISGNGFVVTYIKGVGKRKYTFFPKKKGEIEEVFIIKEVKLNESIILDKLEFVPKYGLHGRVNSIIDFVSLLYELGQGIKGEVILENSKLT